MAHIVITGNVGGVKDLKTSQAGKPYINFSVAWSERQKDKTGTFVDGPTVWVNCTAFGKVAEGVASSVTKGTRVVVAGQLRPEEWSRDTGPETVMALTADSVGVDLTFQDVTVAKRNSGNAGGQQQPDHWNSAPTGGFGQGSDEPPF